MITKIQNIANETQYNSNKEKFVSALYWNLVAAGLKPCIVNDKYIELDGVDYQFIKNRRSCTYTVAIA